ncbi:hypothetical protein CYMTET_33384 [Cymbomonas tetramitiformis]|uniref:Apple domain-containing protein n=1 Tax=Cymbomonas tetramitiformis TaxID=36881 RepID=A0AAE0FDR9_9CHLO|nr:hypothetical protein CYMTET_33384 [Cymbomonas tetramitiformis]
MGSKEEPDDFGKENKAKIGKAVRNITWLTEMHNVMSFKSRWRRGFLDSTTATGACFVLVVIVAFVVLDQELLRKMQSAPAHISAAGRTEYDVQSVSMAPGSGVAAAANDDALQKRLESAEARLAEAMEELQQVHKGQTRLAAELQTHEEYLQRLVHKLGGTSLALSSSPLSALAQSIESIELSTLRQQDLKREPPRVHEGAATMKPAPSRSPSIPPPARVQIQRHTSANQSLPVTVSTQVNSTEPAGASPPATQEASGQEHDTAPGGSSATTLSGLSSLFNSLVKEVKGLEARGDDGTDPTPTREWVREREILMHANGSVDCASSASCLQSPDSGVQYLTVPERVTHDTAVADCLRYNATLAAPMSKEENLFLATEMEKLIRDEFWIGAHYDMGSATWRWPDHSSVEFEMFPSDLHPYGRKGGKGVKHCAYSNWHVNHYEHTEMMSHDLLGIWDDEYCTDVFNGESKVYACQMAASTPPPPASVNRLHDAAMWKCEDARLVHTHFDKRHNDVDTLDECKQKCLDNDECTFFEYDNDRCKLKYDRTLEELRKDGDVEAREGNPACELIREPARDEPAEITADESRSGVDAASETATSAQMEASSSLDGAGAAVSEPPAELATEVGGAPAYGMTEASSSDALGTDVATETSQGQGRTGGGFSLQGLLSLGGLAPWSHGRHPRRPSPPPPQLAAATADGTSDNPLAGTLTAPAVAAGGGIALGSSEAAVSDGPGGGSPRGIALGSSQGPLGDITDATAELHGSEPLGVAAGDGITLGTSGEAAEDTPDSPVEDVWGAGSQVPLDAREGGAGARTEDTAGSEEPRSALEAEEAGAQGPGADGDGEGGDGDEEQEQEMETEGAAEDVSEEADDEVESTEEERNAPIRGSGSEGAVEGEEVSGNGGAAAGKPLAGGRGEEDATEAAGGEEAGEAGEANDVSAEEEGLGRAANEGDLSEDVTEEGEGIDEGPSESPQGSKQAGGGGMATRGEMGAAQVLAQAAALQQALRSGHVGPLSALGKLDETQGQPLGGLGQLSARRVGEGEEEDVVEEEKQEDEAEEEKVEETEIEKQVQEDEVEDEEEGEAGEEAGQPVEASGDKQEAGNEHGQGEEKQDADEADGDDGGEEREAKGEVEEGEEGEEDDEARGEKPSTKVDRQPEEGETPQSKSQDEDKHAGAAMADGKPVAVTSATVAPPGAERHMERAHAAPLSSQNVMEMGQGRGAPPRQLPRPLLIPLAPDAPPAPQAAGSDHQSTPPIPEAPPAPERRAPPPVAAKARHVGPPPTSKKPNLVARPQTNRKDATPQQRSMPQAQHIPAHGTSAFRWPGDVSHQTQIDHGPDDKLDENDTLPSSKPRVSGQQQWLSQQQQQAKVWQRASAVS